MEQAREALKKLNVFARMQRKPRAVVFANWTPTGWTVGGGLEWMFAPGWSVFAEYDYMDLRTNTITFIAPPPLLPVGEHISIRQKASTALVGVNYKFSWGGPVVARY